MPRRRIFTLFTVLLFMATSLAAAQACGRFFPDGVVYIDNHPAYAVAKRQYVSLHCPTSARVIAHDPFLGLCLFERPAKRPFRLTAARKSLTLCPDGKKVRPESFPVGIRPGRLNRAVGKEGGLFGDCCLLAGLAYADGRWYDAAAVRRLMKGDTYHGDIGVRWRIEEKAMIVESVDPFIRLDLQKGDRLLAVGKKRHADWRDFWRQVDRCQPGSTLSLRVERQGKTKQIKARCFRRMGGGRLSDTYLERFGLQFDAQLRIARIAHGSVAYRRGLRVGDRLLRIDNVPMPDASAVRRYLSEQKAAGMWPERFLWDRNDFQFFLFPFSL